MKRKHLSPLPSNKVKQESAADSGRLSNAFVKVSFRPQMNGKWNICITFALFSFFQGPTIHLKKNKKLTLDHQEKDLALCLQPPVLYNWLVMKQKMLKHVKD